MNWAANIYDDLHKLREYRNRVHIQLDSELPDVSRDEDKAFSKAILSWALKPNISILEHDLHIWSSTLTRSRYRPNRQDAENDGIFRKGI